MKKICLSLNLGPRRNIWTFRFQHKTSVLAISAYVLSREEEIAENDVARIRCQLADDSLLPAPPVSQGALSALASVLYPYQRFVKSSIPPSVRRGMLLATIEKLRTRITTLSSQGAKGTRLLLTDEEVSIIDQALTFFIQSIKSMVPASQQQDETLEACRHLQILLKETFSLPL